MPSSDLCGHCTHGAHTLMQTCRNTRSLFIFKKWWHSTFLQWLSPLWSVKSWETDWLPAFANRLLHLRLPGPIFVCITRTEDGTLSSSLSPSLPCSVTQLTQFWQNLGNTISEKHPTKEHNLKPILFRDPLLPGNTSLGQFVQSLGFLFFFFSKVLSKSHFARSWTLKCCVFVSAAFVLLFRALPFSFKMIQGEKKKWTKSLKPFTRPWRAQTLNYRGHIPLSTPANGLESQPLSRFSSHN